MKSSLLLVRVGIVFFSLCWQAHSVFPDDNDAEAQEKRLVLEYGFIHTSRGNDEQNLLSVDSPVVGSGDKLQIVVKPHAPLHLYIYLIDSQNELYVLFPSTGEKTSTSLVENTTYIPGRNQTFVLDNHPGTETFYLLASLDRLADLENATAEFCKRKTIKARQRLLDSIIEARREYSSFRVQPQKAESVAGTIRTRNLGEIPSAVIVQEEQFYAKTIRLKHQE